LTGIKPTTTTTAFAATLTATPLGDGSRLTAETFDRILNLFECGFDDRLEGLFLIAAKRDLRLSEEPFDGIDWVRLRAAAISTEITACEERRR
jgi:hypothetical protein